MAKQDMNDREVAGTLHRQQANVAGSPMGVPPIMMARSRREMIEEVGTADIDTRLVQVHQKNRWFLNELLQKRDGLVSSAVQDQAHGLR